MDREALPLDLDREQMRMLARRAVGRPCLTVDGWTQERLGGGADSRTVGIWRFAGRGRDGDQSTPWSVVLKLMRDTGTWNDPYVERRELLAYQSGELERLPPGLRAARCLGTEERPERLHLVWLEDVVDELGGKWPVERYALAARHVGQLNGAYLTTRSTPDWPWLAPSRLKFWLDGAAEANQRLAKMRDHPLVRLAYPVDVIEGMTRLEANRKALVAALGRLPRTLAHGDAFRRNLFARRGADGKDETVAIDWGFVGALPLGEDAAHMLNWTVIFAEWDASDVGRLAEAVWEGYRAGLADSGWRGDARMARFGYVATAVLLGLGTTRHIVGMAEDPRRQEEAEKMFGRASSEFLPDCAAYFRFLMPMGEEARRLLGAVA